MDPNACADYIIYRNAAGPKARDHIRALVGWLGSGGFAPTPDRVTALRAALKGKRGAAATLRALLPE